MRPTVYIRAIALLAFVAVAAPAFAFKEVPVEGAKSVPQGVVGQDAPAAQAVPDLSLSGNENGSAGSKKGTELRIPGVGSLGHLPKLDFGLELLYGATDQELPQNDLEQIDPEEDMTIRGTLKHNF